METCQLNPECKSCMERRICCAKDCVCVPTKVCAECSRFFCFLDCPSLECPNCNLLKDSCRLYGLHSLWFGIGAIASWAVAIAMFCACIFFNGEDNFGGKLLFFIYGLAAGIIGACCYVVGILFACRSMKKIKEFPLSQRVFELKSQKDTSEIIDKLLYTEKTILSLGKRIYFPLVFRKDLWS